MFYISAGRLLELTNKTVSQDESAWGMTMKDEKSTNKVIYLRDLQW